MSLSALKAKKREQMEAMKQGSEAAATRQPVPQLRAPGPTSTLAAAGKPLPQLLTPPPVAGPVVAADDATECVSEVAAWRAANRPAMSHVVERLTAIRKQLEEGVNHSS